MEINHENESSEETEAGSEGNFTSELNLPCWSVITEKSVAASRLTYEEAVQWANDLKKQGVTGLCVVTDEAAGRVSD